MRTVAFWLSLLVMFMIPVEDSIPLGNFGSVTRLFGLVAAGFWVLTVFVTNKFRKPKLFHLIIVIYIVWNAITIFWSINSERSLVRLMTYVQLFGLIMIQWDLYTTPAKLRAGFQAYILGGYISIGSIISNYLSGNRMEASSIDRFSAEGFDANDISLILALAMPIAWHMAISADKGKLAQLFKLINYCYVPAALLAILLTASRGGLISTFPTFLFILATFTRLKLHLRLAIFTGLIGALLAIQPLIPQSTFDRLATTDDEIAAGDLTGRGNIWRQGFEVFLNHPIGGIGTGAFRYSIPLDKSPHNSYLGVLVETGLIGLILFFIILGITFYHIIQLPKWETVLWLTIMGMWAIGVFVLTWHHRKPTWLVFSLPILSVHLVRERDDADPNPAPFTGLVSSPGLSPAQYYETINPQPLSTPK